MRPPLLTLRADEYFAVARVCPFMVQGGVLDKWTVSLLRVQLRALSPNKTT